MANLYFKNTIILLIVTLCANSLYAQNYDGPGGVGSDTDNRFWFDANAIDQADGTPVATWPNKGGNTNSFNQTTGSEQPVLNLIGPNNQSELNFDGTNDFFDLDNNSDLNINGPWNERSFVLVFTTGIDVTTRQVLYEEGGQTRGLNIYIESGSLFFSGFNDSNDGSGSPWGTPSIEQISTNITSSTSYILTVVYKQDGGDNITGAFAGYLNNASFGANTNIGILYAHAADINLAGNEDNLYPSGSNTNLYPFKGTISEYIIYNRAINNSERIIINNYLSSKYDINLAADNEYFQDISLAGDFDFNVIGVRQIIKDSSINSNFGTGIVGLKNFTSAGSKKYIYVGSDKLDQTELLPFSGCINNKEVFPLNTLWRISSFDDSSFTFTVADVELDTSQFNLNMSTSPSDYKLIIDDNPSFTSPTIFTGDSFTSGVVTFDFVNLPDGSYMTFEVAADKPLLNTVAGLNLEQELRFHFEANSINQDDGTAVSNWNNQGANPLNALTQTNSPSLSKDVTNGQDFVRFESANSESFVIGNNSDINDDVEPWEERSYSLVFQTGTDVTTRQMLYEEGGINRGVNIYLLNGNIYFGAYNKNNDGLGSPWTFKSVLTAVNPNTTYVLTNIFSGNSTTTGSIETFLNGDSVGVTTGVGLLYGHTANISIGQNGDGTTVEGNTTIGDNQYYNGLIGEFLFYNMALNQNQIDLLNNFLMAKYGVMPSANDIYVYDTTAEGDFDFNLVGVRDLAGNRLDNTTFSTGVLKMSNPSSLGTGEHIIAASDLEDQTILDTSFSDCTTTTSDDLRLDATWRVDVQGSPGNIDIELDYNKIQIDVNDASELDLLISNDPTFPSGSTTRISPTSFCSTAQYLGVSFTDGEYFTFERTGIAPVTWDGASWANGSGVSNEPTVGDQFKKIVVSGSSGVLSQDAGCSCLIVQPTGALDTSGFNLNVKADIQNDGSITALNSEILFTGESLEQINGNGFESKRFLIDNKIGLNLNLSVGENISLNSALKLVDGDFNTNGQLVLKSSDAQTAIVEPVETGASITGEVLVERRIPQSNRSFRYISSPVNTTGTIRDNLQEGVNNPDTSTNNNPNPGFGTHITGSSTGANGFDATSTGNASMYEWNVGSQSWSGISDTDTKTLNVGEAYALMIRGDRSTTLNSNTAVGPATTLRFRGTLETGQKPVGALNLSGVIGDFNLIANPYQAQVNTIDLLSTSSANVNTSFIYVYDPTIGTRGGYATVDLSDGSATGQDIVDATPSTTNANQFLQPNQAFFVETSGASPSITFEETHKSVSPLTTATFLTSETSPLLNIDLKRSNNNVLVDGIKLKFDDTYLDQIDNNDAVKAWNFDESIAYYDDGNYTAINKRTQPAVNDTIQLFMFNYQEQNYSLDLTLNALDDNITVYLQDNYLDNLTEMMPNTINTYNYSIDNAVPASTDGFRFSLVFDVETLSVDDNTLENSLSLYPNPVTNNIFTLSSQQLQGQDVKINIVNLTGQLVYSENIENANSQIEIQPNQQLSTGIYLVKISTNDVELTKKIIVE